MIRIKKRYTYMQIIAMAIAALLYLGPKCFSFTKNAAVKDEVFVVTRVVDGDTLKLSNGQRVRLIGVDTPEMHYSNKLLKDAKRTKRSIAAIQDLGRKASQFTKNLCEGKKVRLEFDVEKYDHYKRILAYVYLEDGTFVNAKIIEEGFAQIMTIPPNVKFADYFLELQKKARDNHKGLWADTESI